jgi:hypothetical protein
MLAVVMYANPKIRKAVRKAVGIALSAVAITTFAHVVQEIARSMPYVIPHGVTASDHRDRDRMMLVWDGPESSEPQLAPATLVLEPPPEMPDPYWSVHPAIRSMVRAHDAPLLMRSAPRPLRAV